MDTRKISQPRTRVGRRRWISDSARLVAASAAAAALPLEAAAAPNTGQSRPGPTATPPTGASGQRHLRHLNPPTIAAAKGYTHVVEATAGRTLYISGQVSLDPTSRLVGPGDLRAQTRQVFENLKAALDAAGATFTDVVKLTYYLLDASQVQTVRDVRDTFIDANAPPASSLVEVRRLLREEFLIEIDAIACVRS